MNYADCIASHTYYQNIGQNPNSSRSLKNCNDLEPADTNQIRTQGNIESTNIFANHIRLFRLPVSHLKTNKLHGAEFHIWR